MSHYCHAELCGVYVPPKMFMCKNHWFKLPKVMRDRIWAEYRPGQEVDKEPSAAYIRATNAAKLFIAKEELTVRSVAHLKARYAELEAAFDKIERDRAAEEDK